MTVTGPAPAPPAYLTAHAKRLWRELIAEFGHIGLITPPDRYTFGMFCQALARVIEAEKILSKQGLVVEEPVVNRHGNDTGRVKVKQHPAVAVAKMYSGLVNQIGARFGLSPADRARVTMPQPEDDGGDTFDLNPASRTPFLVRGADGMAADKRGPLVVFEAAEGEAEDE